MTQAKHTPGPWAAYGRATFSGHKVVDANKRSVAAFPSNGTRPADERNANAALIAAAPELLTALQNLLAVASVRIDDPRIAQWDAARAAIAKATGATA